MFLNAVIFLALTASVSRAAPVMADSPAAPKSKATPAAISQTIAQLAATQKNKKTVFETCAADSECQQGCCGFKTGKCAGPDVAQSNGSGGCGHSNASPNCDVATLLGFSDCVTGFVQGDLQSQAIQAAAAFAAQLDNLPFTPAAGVAATSTAAAPAATTAASRTTAAAPSSTSSSSGFQLQNGLAAQKLNAGFQSLTAKSSCTPGQQACIGNSFAQCESGAFVLTQCAAGTICAALPLVNSAGTSIGCDTSSDVAARIAATGAAGGITGSGSSSSSSSSTDSGSDDGDDDNSGDCDTDGDDNDDTAAASSSGVASSTIVLTSPSATPSAGASGSDSDDCDNDDNNDESSASSSQAPKIIVLSVPASSSATAASSSSSPSTASSSAPAVTVTGGTGY